MIRTKLKYHLTFQIHWILSKSLHPETCFTVKLVGFYDSNSSHCTTSLNQFRRILFINVFLCKYSCSMMELKIASWLSCSQLITMSRCNNVHSVITLLTTSSSTTNHIKLSTTPNRNEIQQTKFPYSANVDFVVLLLPWSVYYISITLLMTSVSKLG